MIRIIKSKDCFHLIDDKQSFDPFVYDDIDMLLEDLKFLLEAYL